MSLAPMDKYNTSEPEKTGEQTESNRLNHSDLQNDEKQQHRCETEEADAGSSDSSNGSNKPNKSFSFYLAFLALNMTVLIVSLDVTVMPVAIPAITRDLEGTTLEAFWANLSYILAIVITQPIYTSVSDVAGRKTPLYVSFILFLIGSIVFATARHMSILVLGRTLQGLGGGGLDVLGEIILADITTLKERPLYLGLFAIPMAGGGICGPIIGAAFSEYVSWRWIGWINLPLIAVGLILSFFFLRQLPINRTFESKLRSLDWLGMFLFTAGSTTLALSLTWGGVMYPWSSWRTVVPLLIGAILLVVFAVIERWPKEAIFPYRIFSNRTAAVTLIGAAIHGLVLYSTLFYAPLFFQAVLLETPFQSAISILPAGVTIVGFSVLSAVFVQIVRSYWWVVVSNWLLSALGVGLWALWQPSSTRALLYGLQVLAGIGVGTLFTVLTIPMQASVENVDDMGMAAGVLVSFRLFGGLLGLAICTAIFDNTFAHHIAKLGPLPTQVETLKDVREAIAFIPNLRVLDHDLLPDIIDAYRVSMMAVFLTVSGIAALGFLTSFLSKELSLEKEDLGKQRLEKRS